MSFFKNQFFIAITCIKSILTINNTPNKNFLELSFIELFFT